MSKFKVGDKVRVRKDLKGGNNYNGVYFNNTMERYDGFETIILNVTSRGDYRLKNGGGYLFSDDMLEPIQEDFTCTLYYDEQLHCWFIHAGDLTICTKDFGVSKKHPNDEYCQVIGDSIAYKRFMEGMRNE